MADGTGDSPSRPGPGHPSAYVPSYDAPTGPLPRLSLDDALAGTPAATSRRDAAAEADAEMDAEMDAETAQIDAVRIWAADSVRVVPGTDAGEQDVPAAGGDASGTAPDAADHADDVEDTGDTVDVRKELAVRRGGSGDAADVISALKAARGAAPAEPPARGPAPAEPHTRGASQAEPPARGAATMETPAGFPRRRPYAAPDRPAPRGGIPRVRAGEMPDWPEPIEEAPRAAARPHRNGPFAGVVQKVGDIPIRVVYGVCAAIVTGVVVVLIFALFGGDRPEDPMRVSPAEGGGPPASATPAEPTPTPIAVPPVPEAKDMTVFDGPGTPVASYVLDRKAGLSYPRYAGPWAKTTRASFSAAQRAGPATPPMALIGSAPLPGSLGKQPQVYSDFRRLAGRAAKWTLRHQPKDAKFSWTTSQRTRNGVGWLLGYKLTYRVDGKKHTSQTYVMVVATGRAKPAMLFATVPDTRPALYRDLNMLFWSARPI